MHTPFSIKAEAIERDLGVPHPRKLLAAALRRRDGFKEVTPFQRSVVRDRLNELTGKGYSQDDAQIILLMRGARIEALANAFAQWPSQAVAATEEFAANIKARLRQLSEHDLDPMYGEAQAIVYLWRRV